MNARDNTVVIQREAICDKAIWTGAKNYVLRVVDEEGKRLEKPSVTIKGLKGFKPANSELARGAMRDAVGFVLNGDLKGLREYVEDFKTRFYTMVAEDIAVPRSVSGLAKYAGEGDELYKAKVPIQVRGALVYNQLLRRYQIKGLAPIHDGDKAKYCYLKTPNPAGEDVITIINSLPRKFKLEKYIDYYKMFDKTFLSQIDIILNAVDWELEEHATLEGLFD
jgi:DNA polymerase elongation subunit (family B)